MQGAKGSESSKGAWLVDGHHDDNQMNGLLKIYPPLRERLANAHIALPPAPGEGELPDLEVPETTAEPSLEGACLQLVSLLDWVVADENRAFTQL